MMYNLLNNNRSKVKTVYINYQSHLGQTTKEYPHIPMCSLTQFYHTQFTQKLTLSQLILPERTDEPKIYDRLPLIRRIKVKGDERTGFYNVSSQRSHSSRLATKGIKSLEHTRLYTTKSIKPRHVASAKTRDNKKPVGLEEIAKHYVEAYQRPDAKHTNLKRLIRDLNL